MERALDDGGIVVDRVLIDDLRRIAVEVDRDRVLPACRRQRCTRSRRGLSNLGDCLATESETGADRRVLPAVVATRVMLAHTFTDVFMCDLGMTMGLASRL